MKQSFGKTLMSCFLAVTLMASVIAGAISVSVLHAKADTQAYYLDDLKDLIVAQTGSSSAIDDFFVSANNYINLGVVNNLQYFVMGLYDPLTSGWMISIYSSSIQYGSNWYSYALNNVNGINRTPENTYDRGSVTCIDNLMVLGSDFNFRVTGTFTMHFSGAHRFNTTTFNGSTGWRQPCPSSYNTDAGYTIFSSVDIIPGSGNWGMGKNLFGGSAPPTTIDFELVKFKLGERSYLTTRDQNIIFNTQPLDDDYLWWIVYFENEDESEFDHLILEYKDLTLIPGADSWLNVGLQNVHSQGVLALDITDYSSEWYDVWKSDFYWIIENPETEDPSLYVAYASAVNVPFVIVDQPNGQPDSYTQAFNEFNTYVTTYNTTHVIPENLAQTLFGVEGGKLYPVTVSEPSSVAATRNDGALVDGNLYTFQWSMTEPSNLGYNYDLFDVVIIPSNYAGYYGLVYFYDSSLNPPYQFVDRVSFDSLLDSFDCIIILPDDAGTLEDNTWWQLLVPSSMRGDMAVGGTSSKGIEYVDTVSGNEFQGFMIVTQKAIQKQQLWNFNDGITKLYKLEVDYIDSEDKWKDSFLLWSASIFDMLNSIDGRLNSILTSLTSLSSVIDQIKTTLDEIAADPDPDEVKPWYLSLWLFMKQFEPSNAQISEGLGYLVDNIDDIPLLPALTPVPALPTPGGG